MRYFRFYVGFIISLSLVGCQKENQLDCFKSTGKQTKETRILAPFETIKLQDDAEIILIQDTEYFIEIDAGDNLISNILSEVKDQELTIQNINKCNWVRSYKNKIVVTVHTPKLVNLFHNGTNTIQTQGTFEARQLFIHQTGAGDYNLNLKCSYIWLDMYHLGDMKLQGNTDTIQAYLFGLGSLKAGDLQTNQANFIMNGTGEGTIQVKNNLNATLSGNGNLYYSGEPANTYIQESGKGKVIKL